eukprot:CAMPEP_0175235896 /NCGR_PEP_ID=MMETSP0093-20121207/27725_1 /TAXON_ID=311494 /ORGANISM="Alexandrium monilatum, Strain CCMP3105" /LENGTH=155 /DNA_ID=CAMNT_0016529827 /DNA_START=57 /DNA_END=523 /DNA_ORIENTATION=-
MSSAGPCPNSSASWHTPCLPPSRTRTYLARAETRQDPSELAQTNFQPITASVVRERGVVEAKGVPQAIWVVVADAAGILDGVQRPVAPVLVELVVEGDHVVPPSGMPRVEAKLGAPDRSNVLLDQVHVAGVALRFETWVTRVRLVEVGPPCWVML